VVIGDGAGAVAVEDGGDEVAVVDERGETVDVDVDVRLWASAGSWPVTSCRRIPPEVARNVPAARPATRRRIERTRRRRSASRRAGVGKSVGFTLTTVRDPIRSAVTVV
jgi:hypothetical protein